MANRLLCWIAALLMPCVLLTGGARADEAGYNAAAYLLRQAGQPYRDGRHNVLLRGLRQLGDKDLLPFFTAMSNSQHAPHRVHGLLGVSELSPQRQLDLATLAEIENDAELVEVLSAALDDEMIDKAGMATLLAWDGLSLAVRQAIALRLISEGGTADVSGFRESIEIELDDQVAAARVLQYALGALVLAESGDKKGKAALDSLADKDLVPMDAVLAQVIDVAMRQGLGSAGPLALVVSGQRSREATLRLLALQAALRLEAPGASEAWQATYANELEPARRIRIAMIAMDAAPQIKASAFQTLSASDNELVRLISQGGAAINHGGAPDKVAAAFLPMINAGHPMIANWVVTHCRREEPAYGPALLEQVILRHDAGAEHHRGRLADAAIGATHALCELYPEKANVLLADIVSQAGDSETETQALRLRQIVLLGAARARGVDLGTFAKTLDADYKDFTAETLRLLIRARYGAPLTVNAWERVSDRVQGVGQIDPGMRVQLAWLYLQATGKAEQAINDAIKP